MDGAVAIGWNFEGGSRVTGVAGAARFGPHMVAMGAEGRRREGVRADSPSASSRRAEGSSCLIGLGMGVARAGKN